MQVTNQLTNAINDLENYKYLPRNQLNEKINNIIESFGYLFSTATEQETKLKNFIEKTNCDESLINKIDELAGINFVNSIFKAPTTKASKKRKTTNELLEFEFESKKIKNNEDMPLLPQDMLLHIQSYLSESDLIMFSCMNKKFYSTLPQAIAKSLLYHEPMSKNFVEKAIDKSGHILTHLNLLYLKYKDLTDDLISNIFNKCTALQSFKFNYYGEKNWKISKQTRLEKLFLDSNFTIIEFDHFSKLTYLDHSNGKIQDLQKLTNLRKLKFFYDDPIDLKALTLLTHLYIRYFECFKASEVLSNIYPYSLEKLEIVKEEHAVPAENTIIDMKRFTNLRHLYYSSCSRNLSRLDINTLSNGLTHLNLLNLKFINTDRFSALTNLKFLNVYLINDADFLMYLPTNLETLGLIGLLKMNLITAIQKWSLKENTLKELIITSTRTDQNKEINLEGLSNNTSLTSLQLKGLYFKHSLDLDKLAISSLQSIYCPIKKEWLGKNIRKKLKLKGFDLNLIIDDLKKLIDSPSKKLTLINCNNVPEIFKSYENVKIYKTRRQMVSEMDIDENPS